MNQVCDGSFSDALHATLLLKDPLRDWCEGNIIGQTAITFFSWEKACKEGPILHWTSPKLPEQGGSEFMLQRQRQMSTWNLTAKFQNGSAWSPVTAQWRGLVRFRQSPIQRIRKELLMQRAARTARYCSSHLKTFLGVYLFLSRQIIAAVGFEETEGHTLCLSSVKPNQGEIFLVLVQTVMTYWDH